MANQNKQNQGGGGQMGDNANDPGKGAGGKPFGGDASERSQPGLEEDSEEQGYDIDIEGPTKKEAGSPVNDWRDRPEQGSNKPQK